MSVNINILAIESSCDDTSVAVVRDGQVLSNVVASQEVHQQYGGVVPEHASRAHLTNIVPTVSAAMQQAGITPAEVTAVAFTRGPGLMGSLVVGVAFAKAFALSRSLPLIEVHHLQAHVLAHFAEPPVPSFPFLCLTVSGGHTQIVRVDSPLQMVVLGSTLDDAAGEAFDKTGKLMGLPYPAGPHIDRLARQGEARYPFPEPQLDGLDFSFSGLKTSFRYFIEKQQKTDPAFVEKELPHLCASIQQRIVSILLHKLQQAALLTGIREIAIAGGVSANTGLRQQFIALGAQQGWRTYIPAFAYSTDNAGMIGVAAHFKYLAGDFCSQATEPAARLAFDAHG